MRLVNKIESVVHYEVYDDCVFIGKDTRIKQGLINNGNQIIKQSIHGLEIMCEEEYFYFTGFKDGFIYNRKEGEGIQYSTGNRNVLLTPEKHYFSPLGNFNNRQEIVITEMNDKFQQNHYLLNGLEYELKRKCEVYPNLNNSKYYGSFHNKNSKVEIVNKRTGKYLEVEIQPNGDRMDRRGRPILDSNNIFIPLINGSLAKFNCESNSFEWVNREFDNPYVSYNTNSEYIFQHFGLGINQISKRTGKTINQINFQDAFKEEHHSSGRIWSSDKYLITKDLHTGQFCVIDANNLNPIELEFLMKNGFSNSEITFQIIDNKIFALGMDNVLREYEIE